jgi:alkylated DNA repair protein (DNA oxidative demethylase)
VSRRAASPAALPGGLQYLPDFLSVEEEAALLCALEGVSFREVRMKGVAALRTTAHFGWEYGYEAWTLTPTTPPPAFLLPLRRRCAAHLGVAEEALEEVLLSCYPPGAGIGWHRDAPMFGPTVVGVSLGAPARMRLRRGAPGAWQTCALELAPRSLYVLGGEARAVWQHTLSPLKALRYSITFRTLRARGPGGRGLCT